MELLDITNIATLHNYLQTNYPTNNIITQMIQFLNNSINESQDTTVIRTYYKEYLDLYYSLTYEQLSSLSYIEEYRKSNMTNFMVIIYRGYYPLLKQFIDLSTTNNPNNVSHLMNHLIRHKDINNNDSLYYASLNTHLMNNVIYNTLMQYVSSNTPPQYTSTNNLVSSARLSVAPSGKVVNVKVEYIRPKYDNLRIWMSDPNNVYVGRHGRVMISEHGTRSMFNYSASVFSNPFKISDDATRDTVLQQYNQYIRDKLQKEPHLIDLLRSYRGKTLGCWCKPEACHADILLEIINSL